MQIVPTYVVSTLQVQLWDPELHNKCLRLLKSSQYYENLFKFPHHEQIVIYRTIEFVIMYCGQEMFFISNLIVKLYAFKYENVNGVMMWESIVGIELGFIYIY